MYRTVWHEHPRHHWGRCGFCLPGILLLGFLLFFGGKIIVPLLFVGFLATLLLMWGKHGRGYGDWRDSHGKRWHDWRIQDSEKSKNDEKRKNDDLDSQPYI